MSAGTFDPFALGGTREGDAELFHLIAEEYRLREIGCNYRSQADEIYFAFKAQGEPFQGVEEPDLPEPMGSLYRKAEEYEGAADDLYDQIEGFQPTTIEGVVALLGWPKDGTVSPDVLDNVLTALEEIAAREVRS